MNEKRSIFTLKFWCFFLPPSFWLGFFFIVPLFTLWLYSFGSTNEQYQIDLTWTLDNYARSFEPIYLKIFYESFLLAGVTSVICLVVGFTISLFLTFSEPKWKNFWLILIILPFWTNLLIRIFGISNVLRTEGVVNNSLSYLFDLGKSFERFAGVQFLPDFFNPLPLLYNHGSVIVGMVYVSLPFMILPIFASMDKLDRSYIEASLDLGASHFRTLVQVVAPMVKPGIYSGFLLTFIPNLGVFVIPELLGSPSSLIIGNVIQRQFGSGANWPFGSALAFLLIYITFFAFALRAYITRDNKIKKIAPENNN